MVSGSQLRGHTVLGPNALGARGADKKSLGNSILVLVDSGAKILGYNYEVQGDINPAVLPFVLIKLFLGLINH